MPRHSELLPSLRVIVAESLRRTVLAVIGSAAAVLGLDLMAMLAAAALIDDSELRPDRLGRGVLLAAVVAIVLFSMMLGGVVTAGRFALAAFFSQAEGGLREFRDTVRVRGAVGATPTAPTQAALVVLGGLAMLASIPCIVLAVESASTGGGAGWMFWTVAMIVIAVGCLVLAWWLSRFVRRWAARIRERLPGDVVGWAGPAKRVRSRAEARVARRSWSGTDWAAALGSTSILVGGIAAFVGVYLHQPGRYAEPVYYPERVERVLAVLPVGGLVLVVFGTLLSAVVGFVVFGVTLRSLSGANGRAANASPNLRRAEAVLSRAVDVCQGVWVAAGILGAGWWFAAEVETSADRWALPPTLPSALTSWWVWAGWAAVGLVLFVARLAVERQAPRMRNAFGWEPPVEPDDSEYPDISLLP
ncbi:MAG: hypothetical protein IJG47_11690 [Microbacterium sp.]|nr:hypothetical protein [Microbacterium sp.]